MENRVLVIGYVVLVLSLGACGGSGGGGDAPAVVTPAQTAPTNTDSTLRKMKIGDSWTYAMTGDFTGDMVVAITKTIVNPKGVTCFVEETSGTLLHSQTGESLLLREQSYTGQSPTGSRYDCGQFENGAPEFIESVDGLALETESHLRIGQLISGVVTYTSGTWVDSTAQVQSFDTVATPAGRYDSFKIRNTSSYSDGDVSVATEWIAPNIGLVKGEIEFDSESAEIIKFGIELKSYRLK